MSTTLAAPAPAPPSALSALPLSLSSAVPPSATPNQQRAASQAPASHWPENDHAALLKHWMGMSNIAEELKDDEIGKIQNQVLRDYEMDDETRADWKERYRKWMDFAMQVAEEKTYPWPRASNVVYPLLTSAAIQFAARAYPAIIKDRNVVKGSIFGPDDGVPLIDPQTQQPAAGQDGAPVWLQPPGAKQQIADKIGEHMSWQLLDEQEEWEPQTDQLLIILPIVGCMFRKSYFDPAMGKNVSETVDALRVCVNYKARSFEAAPRISEELTLYPWEIEERIRGGVFLPNEYGSDNDAGQDLDAPTTFIEQHRRWDLDQDGYAEPYIITVSKDSTKLARIVAAYDDETVQWGPDDRILKVEAVKYYTKYGFIPSPDHGVYDIGFGHLLYPINAAINTTLNQMFDAGHLQNTSGGFVASNLSINTGAVRFQVGQLNPVNTGGQSLKDSIYMVPFQGPSSVLFSLLQFLVEAGKEIAAVKDIMTGDMPGDNTSGVTTLAVIEQGLKVYSAIYKRIYRALKQEFSKLFRLNRLYLPQEMRFQVGSEWKQITQTDYAQGSGVEPVSDPQMVTDMQKLGRAQFLGTFKGDPWVDQRQIRVEMLTSASFPNVDKLVLKQTPPDQLVGLKLAELKLKGDELEFRHKELDVRAAHEQGDLQIRRGKDKAAEIESLTRAILNLANAHKADHQVDQAWADQQITVWKAQIEALNADAANPADNPAATDGLTGGPGGANAGGLGAVAAPPGNGGVPALPGGPTGGAGAGNGPAVAGGAPGALG